LAVIGLLWFLLIILSWQAAAAAAAEGVLVVELVD
jgi:hypothetical protein